LSLMLRLRTHTSSHTEATMEMMQQYYQTAS
jgi:hypothetical protein